MPKKIWVDSDLLENKSGIGRDSKVMIEWLSQHFQIEVIHWPKFISINSKYRRKILMAVRIVFGRILTLPKEFDCALYQSQLGPVLPGNSNKVWIIRLHDLFPITHPEWFNWWARYVFKNSFYKALEMNSIFLCNSIATQKDLFELCGDRKVLSYVVPCQIQSEITDQCTRCFACKNIQNLSSGNFFLSVGTIEPRKNYALAIETWESLGNGGPSLVIVGKPGWKTKDLQKRLKSAKHLGITWIDECCDGALEVLYLNCKGLISFSFAEGFDLPPMEVRQRHSKPLLLSDIPVHREFHSVDALFFTKSSDLLELLKVSHAPTSLSSYAKNAKSTLGLLKNHLNSVL
jgi:glycosyltransferase involved in cell wall biosynthesis